MPLLSPARAGVPLLSGLQLLNRGKVRDSYLLPCGLILMVATDAISIFDFVLNAIVPQKGIILTAISVFWFKLLEGFGIKHHMVACGSGIDEYLPEELRGNIDLQSRALVVMNLKMVDDTEFIVRGCLTGTGKKAYDKTGKVCGHKLQPDIQDGDELPFHMDTPSSKAKEGHDEHVDAATAQKKYPLQTYLALKIFAIIYTFAKLRGIILADTKFEFAEDGTLADEVGTMDSSRFWSVIEWMASRLIAVGRKAPSAFDKQFVRAWGILMGINDENKFDAKKPEDHARVHALEVPAEVINQTTQIYRYIFWRLTGMTIEDYLRDVMKVVKLPLQPKNVVIVCGSENDLPSVLEVCNEFATSALRIKVNVMSCHRNPYEVMESMESASRNLDLVIAVGSKALALPGVIDAWAYFHGKKIRVAGVALGQTGSEELRAAQLSISQLPGQPVIMNEMTDTVYTGQLGLRELLMRVEHGELPPVKSRTIKPIKVGVWDNLGPKQ